MRHHCGPRRSRQDNHNGKDWVKTAGRHATYFGWRSLCRRPSNQRVSKDLEKTLKQALSTSNELGFVLIDNFHLAHVQVRQLIRYTVESIVQTKQLPSK